MFMSQTTSRELFLNRRQVLLGALGTAGLAALAGGEAKAQAEGPAAAGAVATEKARRIASDQVEITGMPEETNFEYVGSDHPDAENYILGREFFVGAAGVVGMSQREEMWRIFSEPGYLSPYLESENKSAVNIDEPGIQRLTTGPEEFVALQSGYVMLTGGMFDLRIGTAVTDIDEGTTTIAEEGAVNVYLPDRGPNHSYVVVVRGPENDQKTGTDESNKIRVHSDPGSARITRFPLSKEHAARFSAEYTAQQGISAGETDTSGEDGATLVTFAFIDPTNGGYRILDWDNEANEYLGAETNGAPIDVTAFPKMNKLAEGEQQFVR